MTLWSLISVWMPWIFIVLLLICTLVLAFLLIRKARNAEDDDADAAKDKDGKAPAKITTNLRALKAQMRQEIRHALDTLKNLSDSGGNPYAVPWIMTFGLDDAEARAMIRRIDPQQDTDTSILPRTGAIHFCRHGVLFLAGNSLLNLKNGSKLWQKLILLMQACRPHRPVDGLVITLPVGKLLGQNAIPYDILADYGSRISEMVAQAQHISGLRVPVTLVLTGCQNLRGFPEFISGLPDKALDDALGWASPYALDHAFRPEWTEEALKYIATNLSNVIIQQLMAGNRTSAPDALMMLPAEIRALRNRLKPMLAGIFQPSAYHEAFLFRGIYLTGARHDKPEKGAFIEGLFNEKIFREYQLVKPVQGLLTRRTHNQRIAQAALAAVIVLSVTSLLWLHADITVRAGKLNYLMTNIETDLEQRATPANVSGSNNADLAQASATRLLQGLARLDVLGLETPLAPASYLQSPDSTLEQALAIGFDTIIISEIDQRMNSRLNTILQTPVSQDGGENSPTDQLHSYVSQLMKYDRALRQFQALPKLKSTYALADVARYALQINLPDSIHDHANLYRHAMALSSVPTTSNRDLIVRSLITHFTAAYRAKFNDVTLQTRLEHIRTLSLGAEKSDPAKAAAQLQDLHDELDSVIQDLGSKDYGWVNRRDANIGPDFEADLSRLAASSLADSTVIANLRAIGQTQIQTARKALLDEVSSYNIPLLHMENGKATLAPDMIALNKNLADLLSSAFMSEDIPAQPAAASGNRPVLWDVTWLKTAQRLATGYQTYMAGDITKFTPNLRLTITLAAYDQTSMRISRAISAAAQPWDQVSTRPYDLDTEFSTFQSAVQPLDGLSAALSKASFNANATELNQILQKQTLRMLTQINAEASKSALIAPVGDFSWWDGTPSLALQTYGATDLADLGNALKASETRLAALATNYAKPLVDTYSSASDIPNGLVTRWQDMTEALADYEKKSPASVIRNEEAFILGTMHTVDAANCSGQGNVAGGSDPFSVNLSQIQLALQARCAQLQQGNLRVTYAKLHTRFNQTLAGRFPFSRKPEAPFAHMQNVRTFFRELDHSNIRLTAGSAEIIGRQAEEFLSVLMTDKSIIRPMLTDPTLQQPLSFAVRAEFRTNPADDVGGNQIMEWGLDFGGGQRLTSDEKNRYAVWSSGEPARLYVRFARNAPSVPAKDSTGAYKVSGNTAIWEARDPWALVTLISRLTPDAGKLEDLPDHRAETLELKLNLMPNPDAAKGAKPLKQAKLYLRLKLATVTHTPGKPDTQTPVILPAFPYAAPAPQPEKLSPENAQTNSGTQAPRVVSKGNMSEPKQTGTH